MVSSFIYYTNDNKEVAAFSTPLENGKIILCGPHPEADDSWLIDDPAPLNANKWTDTQDIFNSIFIELLSDKNV